MVHLEIPFRNRTTAGQALAQRLLDYQKQGDVIVLALPRGGVPVAFEVARALDVRLDLMLVRKLGLPGHTELAMGAIAGGGIKVMNDSVLQYHPVAPDMIDAVVARETQELQRRSEAYRGSRPFPNLVGQRIILVDDGLATGATMQAAVKAAKQQKPQRIIVAVPVAPPDAVAALQARVDEVVCLIKPEMLMAIGQWYQDFSQTSDEEVLALLHLAWQRACETS